MVLVVLLILVIADADFVAKVRKSEAIRDEEPTERTLSACREQPQFLFLAPRWPQDDRTCACSRKTCDVLVRLFFHDVATSIPARTASSKQLQFVIVPLNVPG